MQSNKFRISMLCILVLIHKKINKQKLCGKFTNYARLTKDMVMMDH